MDYIINPMWFYWINVLDAVHTVFGILTFILGFACITLIIIMIMTKFAACEENERDSDWKAFCSCKKILKSMIPITILIAIITAFIPSKETILTMMIAKYATKENLSFTIDTVKQAVDYIIDAYAKLK